MMNPGTEPSTTPVIPVPGRSCGDCAMCCKILVIPPLDKPYNTWCQHCIDHKHCGIYETRPQMCREYFCHFMLSTLGEEWRPNKCRFMVSTYPGKLIVAVDPGRPDAWRKEPYFNTIRHWSTQILVTVLVGTTTYAVFPDHIDDLGEVTDEHQIAYLDEPTPQGVHRRAVRVTKAEAAALQMQYPQS